MFAYRTNLLRILLSLFATLSSTAVFSAGKSGSIISWGDSVFGVDLTEDFIQIAAGYSRSLGLKCPCRYNLAGDLNNDCRVDFADFIIILDNWLIDCGLTPQHPACKGD